MSVKSSSSLGEPSNGSVIKSGYLKKFKTSKKKFFVLRAETCDSSARLEYYDSEKKFNNGQTPKRSIPLKTCFNINKRLDTKYKNVIALYTKDDCFCVVLETDDDLEAWLKALLSQQQGEEVADGETPRPTFEHVWQVTLLNRGLGASEQFSGHKTSDTSKYRLCLTDKTLSLIRKDCNKPQAELTLSSIRSCGSLKNFFYLEAGRSSVIGAGELWMDTDDSNIAQNVHQTVFHAMTSNSSSSREELGPKCRNRSSSATESSKPNNMARRQTSSGTPKPIPHQQGFTDSRVRCDSMPSRPRTTSEGHHTCNLSFLLPRPLSMHIRDISHSPPSGSPVSPPSAACSTDSAGSSLSIDESEPWHDDSHRRYTTSLTPDEAIAEENCDDCTDSPCIVHSSPTPSSYIPMAPMANSSDDGYVDMSPRGRNTNMSPTASMSSVASGTPSSDLRFAEYPLEKVASYLTPSEEDETSSVERPRTYSMGSRPYKPRIEQNARDRAWSVGSKSKKVHSRVLQPYEGSQHSGPKSSSAPMLSNSRLHSSQSSIDPMDDLMELDFSKNNSNSGYMPMDSSKTPAGYVDMRPGHIEKSVDTTPYVDMKPGSSPAKSAYIPNENAREVTRPDYMDMDSKRNTRTKLSTSPMISVSSMSSLMSTSPVYIPQYIPIAPYTEMNYQQNSGQTEYLASPVKSTLSGYMAGSPTDYMDTFSYCPYSPMQKQNNDDYVEMSLGKNSQTGDYTNMNMSAKKEKNGNKERKPKKESNSNRSQPIAIQNPPTQTQKIPSGYRQSMCTSPKLLPPGNSVFSSLPRQRSRKNSRRDSKDSSSSSVTTPSSSSTIFPISLNSPTSPIVPQPPSPSENKNVTIKVPTAVLNAKYPKSTTGFRPDYTLMDFERKKSDTSDYVNFNPVSPSASTPETADAGDYALMKPGSLESRYSSKSSPSTSTAELNMKMSVVDLKESNRCFKPINDDSIDSKSEDSEYVKFESLVNSDKSRPGSIVGDSKVSRPSSESSEVGSTTSTIVGSRPGSVNSDKLQLHYASLDLATAAEDEKVKSGDSQTESRFSYAEIDFARSDSLKSNQLLNAKIKH